MKKKFGNRIKFALVAVLVVADMSGCSIKGNNVIENCDESSSNNKESLNNAYIELSDGTLVQIIENDKDNRNIYPYCVSMPSATWYFSLDDIEDIGMENMTKEFCEVAPMAELDFADAREALSNYTDKDIPPIDIFTDFRGNASAAKTTTGIYMKASNYIKIFGGWDVLRFNLLHEYIHYLTMKHANCAEGFYAEGIADYYSLSICENRLSKSAWNSLLTEEEKMNWKKRGGWDEENNTLYLQKSNYINAAYYVSGVGMGEEYLSVGQNNITRTSEIQKDPYNYQLSYPEASTMIAYLIDEYGENTVLTNWNNTDNWEEIYGKSFKELYQDYRNWLISIDYINDLIQAEES